jgi:hypothetical protein
MIHFGEIEGLSSKFGVSPETIEKDYCISWLLIAMALSKNNPGLVFYGGTAIKMAYFPVYRFSEDIDFISRGNLKTEDVRSFMQELYGFAGEKANITFLTDTETIERQGDRLQFFINYDGFSELSLSKRIKVDLMFNAEFSQEPVLKKISCGYSDIKNISAGLPVYTLEAIAADKISAILDVARVEPRDLYDLWFLLKSGKLNIEKVKSNVKTKLGYALTWQTIFPSLRNALYKERWAHRLSHQIANIPDFGKVLRETECSIEKHFAAV